MRLITRADFDGLATAVLLKKMMTIDEVKFVHPKDMQDGKIPVDGNDIVTNLPYQPGVGLWFDHHFSETLRSSLDGFNGRFEENAPSTARVVVNHFGEENFKEYGDMLEIADKVDSANLTEDEVLNPEGWILLAFIADSRTGLGYYHGYTISNYDLMMKLIGLLEKKSLEEILEDPDVKERVERYRNDSKKFVEILKERTKEYDKSIVVDLRGIPELPAGNRFVVYSLFPNANISIKILDGKKKEFAVLALGHSIFNRTSKVNIGELMSRYGGGGHAGAGTCQVPYEDVDRVLKEILEFIRLSE